MNIQRFMCVRVLDEDGETFHPTHVRVVSEIDYDALAAEVEALKARLAEYGTHLAGCESWRHPTPDGTPDPARCDCGWTADDAASQPSTDREGT